MFNCITIPADFSPRAADNAVRAALLSGADSLIVRHAEGTDPFSASYREKLLSVFRSAFRHKIKIYLADDSFSFSGTAFGALGSVPDLRAKGLFLVASDELLEGETPLAVRSGSAVVVRTLPENDAYPYMHYPDLILSESAAMAIDFVYRRFVSEYKKFVGYEFAGFVSFSPCFASPFEEYIPYAEALLPHDLFSLFEDDSAKAAYLDLCQAIFEKNYLSVLKAFCKKNALSFSVVPANAKSASSEFCERENALPPLCPVFSFVDMVRSFAEHSHALLTLPDNDEYARRLSDLRRFLSGVSHDVILPLGNDDIALPYGSEFFLVNTSDSVKSVRVSLPDNISLFIRDPENNSLYPLSPDIECEFSPFGFLYIIAAPETSFADELPLRIDGVRFRPSDILTDETDANVPQTNLPIISNSEAQTLTLPDEPLFGKCINFEGTFDALEIKIDAMSRFLIAPPFTVPLFDFCRGAECIAKAYNGSITSAAIT